MTRTVSKAQLKPHLLQLLREVELDGVELVVTDRGRPVARIIAYEQDHRHLLVSLRNSVVSYVDPLEPVGEDLWEASNDAP